MYNVFFFLLIVNIYFSFGKQNSNHTTQIKVNVKLTLNANEKKKKLVPNIFILNGLVEDENTTSVAILELECSIGITFINVCIHSESWAMRAFRPRPTLLFFIYICIWKLRCVAAAFRQCKQKYFYMFLNFCWKKKT